MKKSILLKFKAGFTILMVVLVFFAVSVKPAQATPTSVVASVPDTVNKVLTKIKETAVKFWNTAGEKAFNATLKASLNRIAYDAAKYAGSAGEGQKPLFVVEDLGTYVANLGDAAAGDFISSLGETWQADLCQPADPAVTAKIGLGLVQQQKPATRDCTLSKLVGNYTSAYEKYAAMSSGDYIKALENSFEPGGNEISVGFQLFERTNEAKQTEADTQKLKLTVNQGWLDVRGPSKKAETSPDYTKEQLASAQAKLDAAYVEKGNDPWISSANIFLNQLAYEAYQKIQRGLVKGKSTSETYDFSKINASSGFESLIQYGESVISEKLASVIKPHFDVRSDYSILSDLVVCADKTNPGPNNCVIDDKFSQAISEKLTVGEALDKGYLHGDWLISGDNKADNVYTLRNASILRKYRIVPVGWEQAMGTAISNGYKVTLQDLISCFDGKGTFSNDFDKGNQAWCQGLVDPNWVLKAPLNYCAKQGSGNQILSSIISQDANGSSTLAISRATDYCADNQTCIKEKTDGSCEVYGYCNEESRTWKFGSDSCEPVFNTCQTFTSVSDKKTASFLENTLDYSTCNADNSGCKQYSYNGVYASSTDKIAWNKNYSIFFNSKATTCDSSSEGCTKLLRGKPGWTDVNYIMNTDFGLNSVGDTGTVVNNAWHWPIEAGTGTVVDDGSGKALSVSGQNQATLASSNANNLLPKNLAPISGWSYTLAADIKLVSGSKVTMTLGDNGDKAETTASDWTTISVTTDNTNNLDFKITALASDATASFMVRNLKLTPNNYYPGYSAYAAFPITEKLLPNYLENTCYNSTSGSGDYTLKDNAPNVCSNFARKCNREEVGCELFTSAKDVFAVAAKANVADYCDASCVGYDKYIAKASYFYGASADNLIPDNASTCSADSVGCSSFTNLDAATQGGESVEYYSKVRQCIKPSTASCGDFYSWDSAQLKAMSLEKDSSGDPFIVDSKADAACTKDTYNLPVSDPNYNADCREFYNKAGKITYHLISNTVSCSDDCHTYRLNEKNIDKTALDQASCSGTWDSSQSACYVCQNGGVWDTKQNACIYKVVPSEGTTCSAAEVGCREYNGNNGSNLKLVASYDFESGVNGFYSLVNGGTVNQSTESTIKNGHSLNVTTDVGVGVSDLVKKDSAYVVKFMAKNSGAEVTANISLSNSNNEVSTFNVDENNPQGDLKIKGDSQWHLYEINLDRLTHEPTGESLKIIVNNNLVIDNLVINEITDRYYLIKDSSKVPDICSYDMFDKYQGPNYNLGCSAYKDRAGTTHNLHQFSELCQNSAVGCEQMIQTNNSSNDYDYTINLNNSDRNTSCTAGTPGCIEVKDTQAIYAVYDSAKQCNTADNGCTRFGNLKTVDNTTSWVDVYKKNSPEAYNSNTSSPLCQANEVGCDTWAYGDGSASYFKTPGLNTCVFRNNYWYKSAVKRCDNGDGKITGNEKVGPICSTDSDCSSKKCITDTNDYPCDVSFTKTMGLGGANNRVATPSGAVGLCNAAAAGCSEYIDPVSKYVSNLVYNPTAQTIDNIPFDKWKAANNSYSQRVSVKPNTLYILQVDGSVAQPVSVSNFSITNSGSEGQAFILGEDNQLGSLVSTVKSTSSVMFNTGANSYLTVYRPSITTDTAAPAASISIKEAIINYQLNQNIDTTTCNGLVNTDAGCVLFDARTQVGSSGLKKSIFNATMTSDGSAPNSCSDSDTGCFNNANTVIKVSPDRVCSRWLSCQTYSEDPITHEKTCYKVGECDQLNDKNECGDFLAMDNSVRNISNSQNKNATGYSLLNDYYIGSMKEVGQNTDASYDFENSADTVSCRRDVDVPYSNVNLYSNGAYKGKTDACTAEPLVLSPDKAKTDYPAHGKGYLPVLNYTQVSPGNAITVYTNQDYYINYSVNTKGSGAKAKLLITDSPTDTTATPAVKASFIDTANNGWERKVYKFNIIDQNKKNTQTKIKIYLTSDTTSLSKGYVYFDDVNIAPVLQTGPNSYVARDCRLYPSDDSLSCLSANNNVIKDGLYGYCLQYDQLNPGVCLMWYPIDKISSLNQSSQLNLGYAGKFPLYYCTEANGNFSLVEKRQPFFIKGVRTYKYCSDSKDVAVGFHDSTGDFSICGTDYIGFGYRYRFDDVDTSDHKSCESDYWCVPKKAGLNVSVQISRNSSSTFKSIDDYLTDGTYFTNNSYSNKVLLPTGEDTVLGQQKSDNDNGLLQARIIVNGSAGWYDYNGLDAANNKETEFATPPIRVYDYTNIPSSEDDLKLISKTSSADIDKVFNITCNKFTRLVDDTGTDKAWTGRIGQNGTTTPYFFDKFLSNYGRDIEDVPFGSASFPNGYDLNNSSDLISLRNQYSSKDATIAGRPYGCSGGGCNRIGQCSNDASVYCIYYAGDTGVNSKSCSSGGACIPLWTSVPTLTNALLNLNQIFISQYGNYKYELGSYVADNSISQFDDPGICSSTTKRTDGKICANVPNVSNITLKSGSTVMPISNDNTTIKYGGLYQLEFDAYVDDEQQPLTEVKIYWGKDDGSQTITNFDNTIKEDTSGNKYYHISLSHYYLRGDKHLEVKVFDNWDLWRCSAMNGSIWKIGACTSLPN